MTQRKPSPDRRSLLKTGMAGGIVLAFDLPLAGCKDRADPGHSQSLQRAPNIGSWIRIGADGRVELFTGKAELGQGILTACIQIAADELDVSPERIDITSADTEATPDEGFTFGSLSVQESGMAIRRAGAELRHILLSKAAARLETDMASLTVEDGELQADDGRSLTYWRLAAEEPFEATVAGRASPKPPKARRYAGRSLPRVDIPDKVFGRTRFLHDLRLPEMLHGRVVRPPDGNAWLESLDDMAVRSMAGVEAVVRDGSFLGVLAMREEQAIAAAEALSQAARWDGGVSLPAQNELADFIRHHPAALETEITPARPGEEEWVQTGVRRVSARYVRPFQAHGTIGPSVAVAHLTEDGLTVWSHTQGVYPLRDTLAEALGMDPARLRVIHMEGAGCYGHNGADDAALDAALLARAAGGRPVRLQWGRQDEFRWEPFGSAMVMEVSAALDGEGRIQDWRYDVYGFPHSSRPGKGRAGDLIAAGHIEAAIERPPPFNIPQPKGGLDRNAVPLYDLPLERITEHFIPEAPLRVSALRGLGAYGNVFAIESFIDELAHAAGADPVTLRLAHLGDRRAREVIERAAARAGWGEQDGRGQDAGRGIAFSRYKNAGGYLAVVVFVRVERETGRIRLERAVAAADCGEIINPDGLRNQIEGGLLQSASWTLFESVNFSEEGLISEDWASYPILTFADVPHLEIELIDRPASPPLGAGEVAQGPMGAAIANAVYDATGLRLRDLPLTPDKVESALAEAGR